MRSLFQTKTRLLLATSASLLALSAPAQDVNVLLKDADRYRMTAENLQVDTQITTTKADGTPDKERRYTVFAQVNRQSLVVMQSAAEQGQKVLMLGDDFWLLMPNSQRPLRITPMQKLLGDASTGDIATLSWVNDYTPTLVGTTPCEVEESEAKTASTAAKSSTTCYHLSLQAARKGVTYQRIELWMGQRHHEPVRADLYIQSDKLAKRARFSVEQLGTKQATVSEMQLIDQLSNGKQTRIRYLSRKERTVPAEWLNPMFLVRNPTVE